MGPYVGGAVLTALQAQLSGMTGSIQVAYAVPLLCFLVVAGYAPFVPTAP